MAIAFDASSTGTKATTVASITWNHSCTGVNRILFVSAQALGSGSLSGVTYNNVAMTEATTLGNIGTGILKLFYLINPASGSNAVVVSSATNTIWGSASSYTGVDQSSPIDNTATNSNTSTSIATSVTTIANNCWVVGAVETDASASTAGASTVRRNGNDSNAIGDSNAAQTPAGSVTLTFNCSNGANKLIVASFKPPSSNASFLLNMI